MEEAIVAHLLAQAGITNLIDDRIDWNVRPQGKKVPALVLTKVSGGRDYTMTGPAGLVQARIQIDCWAETYGAALTVGRAVIAALSGFSGAVASLGQIAGSFLDQERHSFEKDPEAAEALHRVSLDFMIWHRNEEIET